MFDDETLPALLLTGLAASGTALSIYMTVVFMRVQRAGEVNCGDDSCSIVMKTPYARSLGFPNFYVAIPFYVALLLFGILRLFGLAAWFLVPVTVTTAVALAMSAYLAYALLVKLKQP